MSIWEILAWLDSCEARGHDPAKQWTSNGTETGPPPWAPTVCQRCGIVLEEGK